VVCNAGINRTSPIYFIKEGELDEVYNTNTKAPIMLIHDLLAKRSICAKASIVFTSSIDAVNPAISTAAYGASKAALTNFMKVCAKELAPRLIRSNAVMPGMVETPILSEMHMTNEELEKDKQQYPLKRYGQPKEIAWAIIYLLSDAAAWVTGSILTIDGGCSIR
jgi:NAD(P)-dependent dehydrogenase (short-subunit alcohol dehydrogenase family)